MITMPDRLSPLIKKLEEGEIVTPKDMTIFSQLQVLDLLKFGDDLAKDAIKREDDMIALLETL